MNIFDKIKQEYLEDKKNKEARIKQDKERRPDTLPVEPDEREEAYLEASKGLSEEEKMRLMTEKANAAIQRLAKKRAEEGYKDKYSDKDPLREGLYKQLMKR